MTPSHTSMLPPPPRPAGVEAPLESSPPPEVRPADLRLVLAAVAIGVAFDLAVRREPASVATALTVAIVSTTLFVSGRLRTRQSRVLVGTAPLFGLWALVHSSPWLIPLDLAAALGLVVLGVATSTRGGLWDLTIRDLARQPRQLGVDAARTVPFLLRGLFSGVRKTRIRQAGAMVTGLAIAAPIVLALVALLAAGDALTQALLSGLSATGAVDHAVVTTVGVGAGLVLLFRAASHDADPAADVRRLLGATEAIVVLASLVVVFGSFALLQLVGALGVAEQLLDDPGETSEWARSGFFQLLWAAGLTLGVLLAVDAVTARKNTTEERLVATLTALTAALTLVVVASSVLRIVRYSDEFGLTMLRLYSALFACWVGAVFIAFGVRMLTPGIGRRWLHAGIGLALGLLLALNVANPEAIVVRWNTSRAQALDADYLATALSADAIPSIVAALSRMEPTDAAMVTARLCAAGPASADGPLSWNRSRARARRSLMDLCDSAPQ